MEISQELFDQRRRSRLTGSGIRARPKQWTVVNGHVPTQLSLSTTGVRVRGALCDSVRLSSQCIWAPSHWRALDPRKDPDGDENHWKLELTGTDAGRVIWVGLPSGLKADPIPVNISW
jgi:hypothetical protein